jgi:hypothetical protein
MVSKGWINEFCLKQSEQYKKENISSHQQISSADIYLQYKAFLCLKDADFNLQLGTTEKTYFSNLLKATTCRNLWDNEVFYTILSTEDEYIQRAINEF